MTRGKRCFSVLAFVAGATIDPGGGAVFDAVFGPPRATAGPTTPEAAPDAHDGRTPAQLRQEVLERLHTLRDWRVVEALKLDQAAAARLLPILARYDDREMSLATERRDIVRGLRAEMSGARPDDARLTAAIGQLLTNRARRRALEDERIGELRRVLTPVQQVKLLLLLPKIEREFSQRVRDVVRGRGRQKTDDDAFAP